MDLYILWIYICISSICINVCVIDINISMETQHLNYIHREKYT